MDKNNSPESLNIYDYLDAHNIRTVGNEESEANYVTNLEGTELVTVNMPQGQNKCIGSKGFENISKAYFIRFNSIGYHQIVEFDFDSRIETVVFENITDSGNVSIINWTANTYFTDIRLIHENFLLLNNGVDPIYFINVKSFKESRGASIRREEDLFLAKIPPTSFPEVEYFNNTLKTTNNLRGKLFQFKYNWEYEDYKTSSWSPTSKRVVPETEPSEGQGQNVSTNNVIQVAVNIGDSTVEKVNIGARWGNNTWLLIKTVTREYILSLPTRPSQVPDGDIQEYYNPSTNEYIFGFYNVGTYPILDNVEVNSQYDHIPHKVETVEVINGNIIALGGLTEGYNRPTLSNVSTNVTYYKPELNASVTTEAGFRVLLIDYSQNGARYNWDIWLTFPPKAGDVFVFKISYSGGQGQTRTERYTVTTTDELNGLEYTRNNIVNYLAPLMPQYSYIQAFPNNRIYFYTNMSEASGWVLESAYVDNANIGTLSTKSISTLKSGATYQWAYAPYDKFGKFFPIVTDNRFAVNTEPVTYTQGLIPQINWNISEEAPEGAVGYKILLSENQTYLNYITLTGVYEATQGGGDYLLFDLKSLDRFSRFENESNVNYDFTKGDKVRFIRTIGNNEDSEVWFRFPFIELDIVDFTIEPDPDDTGITRYWLKVRNTPLLDNYDLTDTDIVMELFTPKGTVVDSDQGIFYEIGLDYPILDGKNTVTSGSIIEGDSYIRGRLYATDNLSSGSTIIEVEDPNFSDNYESNFWSAGRARTYFDEPERTERQGSIRYSDEFTIGSRYNGINRFYAERIYGEQGGQTTSKHGWIRKLESRDNALMCFQEFKVGVIPTYKSIIYDNTDTSLVADSSRIFGSVQYRVGNYGIGNAKESFSVSNDGVMYFLDDNHCVPMRDSLSGLDVIDRNMTKHFVTYVKEAKDRGAKFIGVYDNFYKEWNLTVEDVDGRLISVIFSDETSVYRDTFNPPLGTVSVLQPDNGTVTLVGDQLTYTPNTDYIGTDIITLEYPSPDGAKQKFVTMEVLEGNDVPNPFNFTQRNNRGLNTLVTSNQIVVTGINMPSEVSVTGGEYQINSGSWTSANGTVVEEDTVRVRHTTSSSYDTEVSTVLTIGGVSGTFTSKTVPEDTSPDPFTVTGYVSEDGFANIKVRLEISHALTESYQIRCIVRYNAFGSSQETAPISFNVPAGQTNQEIVTGYNIGSTGSLLNGELMLETSSIPNNTLVTTYDSTTRVVSIQRLMFVE